MLECTALENEPMKNHTTFKIGGPAKLFIYVNNENSLSVLLDFINKNNLPFFVIGKGSNLLVADEGYSGVVLSLCKSEQILELSDENTITCSAGLPLAKVCVFAMQNNLSGLEFAWGIPGSCGGALYMNAGAYGEDISCVISEAWHIDSDNGKIQNLKKPEMELSYRKSYYTNKPLIISKMKFELTPSAQNKIREKMCENIKKRKSKQPIEFPNAGSIFKRPGGGYYAGTLIEENGLKGQSVGGAMVSPKHAGFIINTGGATANDVATLIQKIKKTVKENSGVQLECEVKTLGNISL